MLRSIADDSEVPISLQLLKYNKTLQDCYQDAHSDDSFLVPFQKHVLEDVVSFSQAIEDNKEASFQFNNASHAIALLDAAQYFNNDKLDLVCTAYLVQQWHSLASDDIPDHLKYRLLFHIPGFSVITFLEYFYPKECHRQLKIDYIKQRYKLYDLKITDKEDVFEYVIVKRILEIDILTPGNSPKSKIRDVFRHICQEGLLKCIEWFTEHFHLTADDARIWNYRAFRCASENGHIHVMQWLTDQFRLTVEDARSENNLAFRWAALNGHLHVLQWLTKHFHLTVDDASSAYAFQLAVENGHLHVSKWITEHFHLTVDDARSVNNYAFRRAAANGHLPVLQWISEHFQLTTQDARSRDNFAFREAAANGHLNVLQWLMDHFHLTAEDAKSANAFQLAKQRGHIHVTQWLKNQFGITE